MLDMNTKIRAYARELGGTYSVITTLIGELILLALFWELFQEINDGRLAMVIGTFAFGAIGLVLLSWEMGQRTAEKLLTKPRKWIILGIWGHVPVLVAGVFLGVPLMVYIGFGVPFDIKEAITYPVMGFFVTLVGLVPVIVLGGIYGGLLAFKLKALLPDSQEETFYPLEEETF